MDDQKRMSADCRKMPGEKNCDVFMSGTPEHLLEAAVSHAVRDHGHQDTPELRAEIKSLFQEE